MSQAGVIGGGEGPGGTDLHVAKFIVGTIGQGANYSTIASAITAAPSNSSIFIMPGDYAENLTISKNLNFFSSFDNSLGATLIMGAVTITGNIVVTFNGLRFEDNGGNAIITASASQQTVVFTDCDFTQLSANPMFVNGNSSALTSVTFDKGFISIQNAGAQLFNSTCPGDLFINRCGNSGISSSVMASTISAGNLFVNYCDIDAPITSSGTAGVSINYSTLFSFNGTVTPLTIGGSGTNEVLYSFLDGGTAPGLVVSTSSVVSQCIIFSTNTNAIDGTGTIDLAEVDYIGSSSTVAGTLTIVPQSHSLGLINGGGTAGQVLTSNGPTALPTYKNAVGSGNLVLIQSQVVSSSTPAITFTTGISGTYDVYFFSFYGLTVDTAFQEIIMQLSTDGGSSYSSTGYDSEGYFANVAGLGNVAGGDGTGIVINNAPDPSSGFSAAGFGYLYNFGNASLNKQAIFNSNTYQSGDQFQFGVGSNWATATVVNALQVILGTSGNFLTGNFKLYGIVN